MKKFCLLLFVLSSFICNAQNLNFLGIPLGSSYPSFKQKLLSKGLSYDKEKSNNGEFINRFLFKGTFAGENARITVAVTPKSKLVSCVLVRFINWGHYPYDKKTPSDELQNKKYEEIKRGICSRYPSIKAEDFFYDNENRRGTLWETDNWVIDLHTSWHDGWKNIDLFYRDKSIEILEKKEASEDF